MIQPFIFQFGKDSHASRPTASWSSRLPELPWEVTMLSEASVKPWDVVTHSREELQQRGSLTFRLLPIDY